MDYPIEACFAEETHRLSVGRLPSLPELHRLPATSRDRASFLRNLSVPAQSIALWFLGQNGFVIKAPEGTLIAIDPYLTNSCAELSEEFDLNRIIPVPLEPEDLDVDCVIFTHSHGDHLDLETVRRMGAVSMVAPWDAYERLKGTDLPLAQIQLFHPNQTIRIGETCLEGTFAIPTDSTDLNHMGVMLTFSNGLRFFNTGDTAYGPSLAELLPHSVNLCAICINGGFHNLSHGEAAKIVKAISPHVVIPTHYDLMACNQGNPEMFQVALRHEKVQAQYQCMDRDHIYLYTLKEEL